MNQPSPQDALRLLDQATHPAVAGKLTRTDYANIQTSLQILTDFVEAHTPKVDPKIPDKPKK